MNPEPATRRFRRSFRQPSATALSGRDRWPASRSRPRARYPPGSTAGRCRCSRSADADLRQIVHTLCGPGSFPAGRALAPQARRAVFAFRRQREAHRHLDFQGRGHVRAPPLQAYPLQLPAVNRHRAPPLCARVGSRERLTVPSRLTTCPQDPCPAAGIPPVAAAVRAHRAVAWSPLGGGGHPTK